jgi:hypothetical protein
VNSGGPAKTNFLAIWRGIWLFTWKSHMTWRRLPLYALLLLGLPALVYLTTSVRAWNRRTPDPENPQAYFQRLRHRLERARAPLDQEQEKMMEAIFVEEFARSAPATEDQLRAETPEARTKRVKDCYERIRKRAGELLKEEQMAVLRNQIRWRIQETEQQANKRTWSRSGAYYHWILDFYFLVILPLACVNACGALIRDELQADTLGFLLTRPVSRAQLLAAKYLSQTAWLQVFLLAESLLLVAAGRLQQIPDLGKFLPLFLGAQFLAVFAWSALGLLFGLVARRYIALALVYGLIVERGIGSIPTNINTLSLTRHLKTLLSHHPLLQTIYEWPAPQESWWLAAGALVLAAAGFLGVAMALFTYLEYHHTSEAQK